MPAKNTRNRRSFSPERPPKDAPDLFGLQENQELTLSGKQIPVQDRPVRLDLSFQSARKCGGTNGFIQSIIQTRFAFYHYGFAIVPRKVEPTEDELTRLRVWHEKHEQVIAQYSRDAWLEWLRLCNVVALWRSNSGRPFRVKPEECQYDDVFALEKLGYTHGIPPDVVRKLPGLTPAQRAALEKPVLQLTHEDESLFGFEVLKRAAVGEGLAWPMMQSAFLAASTYESLEVADSQLAAAMRRVLEVHRKGHETRFGLNAGNAKNNVTDAYGKAFLKKLKGVKGLVELVLNWDHAIEWPRPDPKHFDGKRYGAAMEALVQWAMPIGHMLLANTINPYLFEIFRQLANSERDYLRPHLVTVFNKTLRPPVPITIEWDDSCFNDPRLRFDMLKTGLGGGPVSQTTFLKRIGEKPLVERRQKREEAKLSEAETHPIYDPAHGDPKAATGGDRAGRKAGSGDRKGQSA